MNAVGKYENKNRKVIAQSEGRENRTGKKVIGMTAKASEIT